MLDQVKRVVLDADRALYTGDWTTGTIYRITQR